MKNKILPINTNKKGRGHKSMFVHVIMIMPKDNANVLTFTCSQMCFYIMYV